MLSRALGIVSSLLLLAGCLSPPPPVAPESVLEETVPAQPSRTPGISQPPRNPLCARPPPVEIPPAPGIGVWTLAGRGPGSPGEGGAALEIPLAGPADTLALPDGSVLVADAPGNRVWRISPQGSIHAFAGTGAAEGQNEGGSRLGDGGPAIEAPLRFPRALALDLDGSVLIADTNHYIIRRVTPDGVIHRVGGSRNFAFSGEGSSALDAGFGYPIDLAVDLRGNVYVADAGAVNPDPGAGNRVRKISPEGVVTTILGGSKASGKSLENLRYVAVQADTLVVGPNLRLNLSTAEITVDRTFERVGPLAADNEGNLFGFDSGQPALVSFRDGTSVNARGIRSAVGLSVEDDGTAYVADDDAKKVWKVNASGAIPFAGADCVPDYDGPAGVATIFDSQGAAFDAQDNFYFTDFQNNRIRRLTPEGDVETVAGTGDPGYGGEGDGGHPLHAGFAQPRALLFDPHGRLLFIDERAGAGVVRAVSPGADGEVDGSPDERIVTLAGRALPRERADRGTADGRSASEAVFVGLRGIAIDGNGRLLLADWLDNRIRVIHPGPDGILDPSDTIETLLDDLRAPNWLAVSRSDKLVVQEVPDGGAAQLSVLDLANPTRIERTILLGISVPSFLFDSQERLVVSTGKQLRRVNEKGSDPVTVAGTEEAGHGGDGGPAEAASFVGFGFPALRSDGAFVAVDSGAGRIRGVILDP